MALEKFILYDITVYMCLSVFGISDGPWSAGIMIMMCQFLVFQVSLEYLRMLVIWAMHVWEIPNDPTCFVISNEKTEILGLAVPPNFQSAGQSENSSIF